MCKECDRIHQRMRKCTSLLELRESQKSLDRIGQSCRHDDAGTHKIYSKKRKFPPMWQPAFGRRCRPPKQQLHPSAAALSYTYAFEQYHQGYMPGTGTALDSASHASILYVYNKIRPALSSQPHNFSYNLFS